MYEGQIVAEHVRRDGGGDRGRDAGRSARGRGVTEAPTDRPPPEQGEPTTTAGKLQLKQRAGRDHPSDPDRSACVLHGRARHLAWVRTARRVQGDPRRGGHRLVLELPQEHRRPRSLDVQPHADAATHDDVRAHGARGRLRVSLRHVQHRRTGQYTKGVIVAIWVGAYWGDAPPSGLHVVIDLRARRPRRALWAGSPGS